MLREELWDNMTVADVYKLIVTETHCVTPETTLVELLPVFNEDLRTRHVYVVDNANVLVGVVRMNDIVRFLFPYASLKEDGHSAGFEFSLNVNVKHMRDQNEETVLCHTVAELMNDEPRSVTESTRLDDMAAILIQEKINELPVVDDARKVIGQVNVYEVIHAFLEKVGN